MYTVAPKCRWVFGWKTSFSYYINRTKQLIISLQHILYTPYQMMRIDTFRKILLLALICVHLTACQRYNWTKPDQINKGLPSSIQIYILNTTDSPFHTKLTGGFARFNMNDSNLQFVVKDTNGDALGYFPKTPQQYAVAGNFTFILEQNVVYAVINGGYFNMVQNISASFIAERGRVKNKNDINQNDKNHPTVGAFGLTKSGKFETQWIYSYGTNLDTSKFRFPNPYPGPIASKDTGEHWDVLEGIGAGPVLVKNREMITKNFQNFGQASMINTRHPRSAICMDLDNRLYFVAIDGRYSGSDGLYMPEIADVMHSLYCQHALNLDGGGSTNLWANGKTINRPSDATGPRPVVSAVLIRDKYKKKSTIKSE